MDLQENGSEKMLIQVVANDRKAVVGDFEGIPVRYAKNNGKN